MMNMMMVMMNARALLMMILMNKVRWGKMMVVISLSRARAFPGGRPPGHTQGGGEGGGEGDPKKKKERKKEKKPGGQKVL